MRRLVLFDIDGTLLSADGAGKRAIRSAMLQVFGTTGPIRDYSFGGRTDPEIVRDLLRAGGLDDECVDAGLPELWRLYVAGLEQEIAALRVRPLPGIPELLRRVEEAGAQVVLGLLTGNVREGARIKVDAAGLGFHRFRVGAFGSDHAARTELPAIAARRARVLAGTEFTGKEIVIIGDTPKDIACGAHLGVRTIATATGTYSLDELSGCRPDYAFTDLRDVDAAWSAITAELP